MKQFVFKSILVVSFLILSNCGYKVLDNLETNFSIKEINASGDKRINFKIKNSLIIDSSYNKTNTLILTLDTKKTKKIKEKNIKNEITKYKIFLTSNIRISFIEKDLKQEFSVSSSGDYLAGEKYSATLQNEKRLIEDLTNDLADKIKNKLI